MARFVWFIINRFSLFIFISLTPGNFLMNTILEVMISVWDHRKELKSWFFSQPEWRTGFVKNSNHLKMIKHYEYEIVLILQKMSSKNKTKYFRLRLYDSDFNALIALWMFSWVVSECSLIAQLLWLLSDWSLT